MLSSLRLKWGFDLSAYNPASLKRRFQRFLSLHKISNLSDLEHFINNQPEGLSILRHCFSVHYSEFFREPENWRYHREVLLPRFRGKRCRIWMLGCSWGMEVISMAILVEELQLGPQVEIIASDWDEQVLRDQPRYKFSLNQAEKGGHNYRQSNGLKRWEDYFQRTSSQAHFRPGLLDRVRYLPQDVRYPPALQEVDLLWCKNVLIYFSREAQGQIIAHFAEALRPGGLLQVGREESLTFYRGQKRWHPLNTSQSLYRLAG